MTKPELSVCLDDLCLDVKAAMNRARSLGFRAIDIGATEGPISPGELSRTGQRHLLKHLADLGLRLGSLRGPVGGPGYGDAAKGERRLDTMRGTIRLASLLRVPVVSTTLGQTKETDPQGEPVGVRDVLTALADEADRAGVVVAIETAGIAAATLSRLLAEINCPLLGCCCDSGAMLMLGEDPHRVAEALPGRIRLVRARDAVAGTNQHPAYEVAQGEGGLDTRRFLAALTEAGFHGDIVLARTSGSNPAADLDQARAEFERYLP